MVTKRRIRIRIRMVRRRGSRMRDNSRMWMKRSKRDRISKDSRITVLRKNKTNKRSKIMNSIN